MSAAAQLRAELDAKAIATFKARCARCGVELYVIDDDHGAPLFVASRWGMTRQMGTVDELNAFIRAIGGPNA